MFGFEISDRRWELPNLKSPSLKVRAPRSEISDSKSSLSLSLWFGVGVASHILGFDLCRLFSLKLWMVAPDQDCGGFDGAQWQPTTTLMKSCSDIPESRSQWCWWQFTYLRFRQGQCCSKSSENQPDQPMNSEHPLSPSRGMWLYFATINQQFTLRLILCFMSRQSIHWWIVILFEKEEKVM